MESSSASVGGSAANGGVSEPTRPDHVALDVTEGRELQKLLPAGDSDSRGHREDAAAKGTSGDRTAKRPENLAEIQIQGLMWLEQPGNEIYAKAHKTWEAQDALFASRIDKKKEQSTSLRNEIYQLFGFYSVFQGVLLTAVAQSNFLYCHNWWSAFFLSLSASLVSIGGIIEKFLAVVALEKTIKNEADTRQVLSSSPNPSPPLHTSPPHHLLTLLSSHDSLLLQECINRVGRLLRKRGDFHFHVDAQDGKPRTFDLNRLRLSVLIVFMCLLSFSALFLASIYRILCYPGSSPGPSPPPS
jgi:hypothetical protein